MSVREKSSTSGFVEKMHALKKEGVWWCVYQWRAARPTTTGSRSSGIGVTRVRQLQSQSRDGEKMAWQRPNKFSGNIETSTMCLGKKAPIVWERKTENQTLKHFQIPYKIYRNCEKHKKCEKVTKNHRPGHVWSCNATGIYSYYPVTTPDHQ